MGLDMYLTREHYVQNWNFHKPEDRHLVTVLKGGQPHPNIRPERVQYVTEQVAYWRKANAIHRWFVVHVQNGQDECQDHYVDREQLLELVDTCKKVLANHDLAEQLLPPQAGFFFGSTDIDADYFEDLQDTVNQLEPVLAEPDFGDFHYRSSW